jgi:phosphatidylglycerophosphatase A
VPFAPGTLGTLAGVLIAWALDKGLGHAPVAYGFAVVAIAWVAVASAELAARDVDIADPSFVVIDEIAGFVVTVAYLPATLPVLAAGFLVFRAFDITKPMPVAVFERLPGGLGIVADDIAAGLLSHVLLRVVTAFGWL